MTTLEYHRPVRNYPAQLTSATLAISAPPPLPPKASGVVWQLLVPLIGALGSVAFIFYTKISPVTILATAALLVASVGGGVLMRVQQGRAQKQRVRASRAHYVEYVADMRRRLERAARTQRQIAETLYPAPQTLTRAFTQGPRPERLWERQWGDADFLEARVGTGYVPLYETITPPTHAATALDVDTEMEEAAHSLQSDFQTLPDMPVTIPLRRSGSVAVCGDAEMRCAFVRSLLIGLAFNHAPNDLRILLYAPSVAMPRWRWIKWLPHTRMLRHTESDIQSGPLQLCMVAEDVQAFEKLLNSQVTPEFERRVKAQEDRRSGQSSAEVPPHFLILVDEYTPQSEVARLSILTRMLRQVTADANAANAADVPGVGITVLTLSDNRDAAPASLYGRFEMLGSGIMRYVEARMGGRRIDAIQPDCSTVEACEDIARMLTPIALTSTGMEVDLSREVRLLPLLDVQSADEIVTQHLWAPREPKDMMCVPVGIYEDGTPVFLNLREGSEGGMGPHGMLIGEPGMGKSEFLRTLVLGLAATHSPDEVNFILVDYKGENTFADLAKLPHTVGLVTRVQQDVSDDLVGRLHQELRGEQHRRAAVLGSAGVDKISQYHDVRREQPDLPALPYLVIIIDEYAALLQNHQDLKLFFTELGMQGRSLGMNMLLASQSPSGGNLQALETYLRYHICVRTANPEDSNAVLGVPDAYYLPIFVPGLAYLKVGDEVYRKFRSARTSHVYSRPTQSTSDGYAIRVFNHIGALVPIRAGARTTQQNHATPTDAPKQRPPTELTVATQHLSAAAKQLKWPEPHQVWIPPLPRMVTLRELCEEEQIELLGHAGWPDQAARVLSRVPIGKVDQVRDQRQIPFLYDFTGQSGHLVILGAPKAGGSTLLKTILCALMLTVTPQDAQFYVIDAGGGQLDAFAPAPHVGAVCGAGEAEIVRRMLSQARGIIRRREERFRRDRIGGMGAFRDMRASMPPDGDDAGADIFLVIDNINALRAEAQAAGYDGELLSDLAVLASTGLSFGVHLILTAQSDLPAAIANNVLGRIELHLSDARLSALGKMENGLLAASQVTDNVPGRGVVAGPQLFQAALPVHGNEAIAIESLPQDRPQDLDHLIMRAVTAVVDRAVERWSGVRAAPVRLLPALVKEEELLAGAAKPQRGFVLGLDEATLRPLTLDLTAAGPHFVIYGDTQHGKTSLLRLLIAQLEHIYTPDEARFVLIDARRGLIDATDSPYLLRSGAQFGYACTKEMVEDSIGLLKQYLDPRKPLSGRLSLEELRIRKSWSGPRIFLFYDDFEPAGMLGSAPLTPLSELLQQGSDIGFHLVVARPFVDTNRGVDQVFDRVKAGGNPLLVLGSDTIGLVPGGGARTRNPLPAGRGFLVRQREPLTLLQLGYRPPAT